jgi:hypothetical protein
MAGFSFPSVLDATSWNKQKGVPPKSDVAKALDALKKAHSGLDTALLDTGKLKTLDEVQERIDAIDAALKKSVKSAADEARNVVSAASDFKKSKDAAKEAVSAANLVAKAAGDYAGEVVSTFQSVAKELAPKLAKLAAEAKKQEDEEGDDPGEADHKKDLESVANKTITFMKQVQARGPNPAKPIKFLIAVYKKQVFAYVAQAISGSTQARVMRLMEVTQKPVFYRGECRFENKAYTFVGVNVPTSGFAPRVQRALMDLTGKKYKIRMQRPTGETDEVAGEEEADDALEQIAAKGGKEAGKAAEVLARHKKLKPLFDGLINAGSPLAAEVRKGLAAYETNVGASKFSEALKVLDDLEKSLRDKAKAAKGAAETRARETADAAIDKASKDSANQGSAAASTKLAEEWKTAAATARKGINDLAAKIEAEFKADPNVGDAVRRLRALAKGLEGDLADKLSEALKKPDSSTRSAARAALGSVAKVVADDLMKEIDGNELMTNLKVVEPMRKKLVEIGAALK